MPEIPSGRKTICGMPGTNPKTVIIEDAMSIGVGLTT